MNELEKFDKWIADYGDYLYFPYNFRCWQYSLKGTVNGIEGDVALDLSVSVSKDKKEKR
jgi:GH25 family lysozyme M1 (1,4-beta-N-acetylmuramidase)